MDFEVVRTMVTNASIANFGIEFKIFLTAKRIRTCRQDRKHRSLPVPAVDETELPRHPL